MARGGGVIVMAVVLMVMMNYKGVKGDVSEDTAECADQLSSIATCLQYVQGQGKAPTPDCCSGLKQVLSSSKKCLCVIVKDGNDPGLNINVTLALSLPSVCHASANVTQCPALLHLDPNSPEAQVFYEFGKTGSTTTASSPGPAPGPIAGGGASSTASAPQASNTKALMAVQGRGWSLVALFCFFISSNFLAQ